MLTSYGELVVQLGVATGAGIAPAIPAVGDLPHIVILVPAAAVLASGARALAPRAAAVSVCDDRTLNALWLGGAVFVGCWFLGSNFDYRLAALLLTLPALLAWARTSGRGGSLGRAACAIMVGALWTSTTRYLGLDLPSAFPVDEALTFALMVIVAAAMLASRPVWGAHRA